jgi:hypothetical protein
MDMFYCKNWLCDIVIPDAMLLPTDGCFAQEVPDSVYDGLTCPKYALWDSNPGSWLAKEQKSQLRLLHPVLDFEQ